LKSVVKSDAPIPESIDTYIAQFPLDQPLPLALVARVVAFRVTQNLSEAAVL
jgi:hypothetical protein